MAQPVGGVTPERISKIAPCSNKDGAEGGI
jgi:hypothetical protein